MSLNEYITKKIFDYKPKNGLEYVATFFINISSIKHGNVTNHVERVSLLSEVVAEKLNFDMKLAFFDGLLHDVGKIVLPSELFDDRVISQEEYDEIKKHTIYGSEILSNYLFLRLCCGLHHAVYHDGYGLTTEDLPKNIGIDNIKKILIISTIVSICDFIDAFTHRTTKIKTSNETDLKKLLYEKYPNDINIVDIALNEYPNIKYWNEES
jgi:putative nucleotidyltransferase with HDIG domain